MKRGRGPKRRKPLKPDPEKVREWHERTRENARLSEREVLANNPKRRDTRKRRNRLPGARGWTQRVFSLYGRWCVVCIRRRQKKGQRPRRASQAHHAVAVQTILGDTRKPVEEREAIVHDARQGVPICRDCHERHENASRRIPRSRLPAGAVEWAREHGYDDYIERTYPEC